MKKIAIALAALAVVASVASAAVYSQNAVGFINKEAEAGKLVALTIPFYNMNSDDGSWAFDDTQIAADAATASYVYFWDGSSWAPYSKGRNGFKTGHTLKPGECFFFKPAGDMTVTISGEVPDEESLPVAVTGAGNLTAIGSPYPVAVNFDETTLAADASTASYVYFWDGSSWAPYSKGRNGFKTSYELEPGEGFFFKTVKADGSKEWTVEKPYEFP